MNTTLSQAVGVLNSRRLGHRRIAVVCFLLFLSTIIAGGFLTAGFSSALTLDVAAANSLIRDLSQAKAISEVLTFAEERASVIKRIDEAATKLSLTDASVAAAIKEVADELKRFRLQEAKRQDAPLEDDNSTWAKIGTLVVILRETAAVSGMDLAATTGLRITITVMVLLLARVLWGMYRYSVECHAQILDRIEVLALVSTSASSVTALQKQLVRLYPCKRDPVAVTSEGELTGNAEKPTKPDDKKT